jgi:hypothetical protein
MHDVRVDAFYYGVNLHAKRRRNFSHKTQCLVNCSLRECAHGYYAVFWCEMRTKSCQHTSKHLIDASASHKYILIYNYTLLVFFRGASFVLELENIFNKRRSQR